MYLSEIEKYRTVGSTDEWYISKLLDKCASGLDPEKAFFELEMVSEALLKEMEWDIFLNHCQYILKLVRIANTTELPKKLEVEALHSKVRELDLEKHNEVKELFAWFRI
ncbi:hypothetical protein KJI95_16325 [Shewanella sp. JM162201]|uniref:Uncharacterized protein n=1 Tax=Shewanella jiangmenensis TaxID=2837387 RepID=A0ABS5V7X4_9GAMM|nr:hypothetical protein [Shewanella jiangmenensis]MBT1446063.1 hypothetical protein [Shewanella jiangmenensis]